MYPKQFVKQEETTEAPASGGGAPQAPTPAPAPDKPKAAKKAPAKKPAAKKAAKPKKKASGKSGKSKGVTGPAVLKQYAPEYKKGGKDGKAKTVSGNVTIDNGDKLADRLRGKDLDDVYKDAAKVIKDDDDNLVGEAALRKQYKHLNVGMQRMNLGNRMRAILFPK